MTERMDIYFSYERENIKEANKISEQIYERFDNVGIVFYNITNKFFHSLIMED